MASVRRPLASLRRAQTSKRTNRDVSEGLSISTECYSALRTVYLHVEDRKKLPGLALSEEAAADLDFVASGRVSERGPRIAPDIRQSTTQRPLVAGKTEPLLLVVSHNDTDPWTLLAFLSLTDSAPGC